MEPKVSSSKFHERDGMILRGAVLHIALMVEEKARWAMDLILRVGPDESKVIRDMSFNDRMQFLVDLKALDKEERKRFLILQRVRNKLVHHLQANTLEKCFELMAEDPETTILSDYPQPKGLSREDELWNAMQELIDDIGNYLVKIEEYVKEKVTEDSKLTAESVGYFTFYEVFPETMAEVALGINQRYASGPPMSREEVLGLLLKVKDVLFAKAQVRWREKIKENHGIDLDKIQAGMEQTGQSDS